MRGVVPRASAPPHRPPQHWSVISKETNYTRHVCKWPGGGVIVSSRWSVAEVWPARVCGGPPSLTADPPETPRRFWTAGTMQHNAGTVSHSHLMRVVNKGLICMHEGCGVEETVSRLSPPRRWYTWHLTGEWTLKWSLDRCRDGNCHCFLCSRG